MSTATAAEAAPPAKGKKKLIIVIAAVAALVLVGGGAAAFLMKKKSVDVEAEADADGEAHAPAKAKAVAKHDPSAVPVFVPLDPFTVNLADREAERYAQVGITLEIEDAHVGDQIKMLMPAIRNNILMAIADRTAGELLGREGKMRLAEKVRRETSRVLGAEVGDDDDAAPDDGDPAKAEKSAKPPRKAKKKSQAALPVKAVHFSNFIIQ
jgi:flagellar protein FliL